MKDWTWLFYRWCFLILNSFVLFVTGKKILHEALKSEGTAAPEVCVP